MREFAEKNVALDAIDREILKTLAGDGRLSYTELANTVHLSANAVAERVRRLERSGVIAGYHAEIDRAALGLRLHAYIDVKLRADVPAERFEAAAEAIAGIDALTLTTGAFDYTLRVACRDQADLVRLVEALRAAVPIAETYSRLILRERILGEVHAPGGGNVRPTRTG
jgi:Lrp/AsnC family leucine-responsive transcriptional regulator